MSHSSSHPHSVSHSIDSAPGTFPVKFVNGSGGQVPDNQIYVMVLGQTDVGWHYLKADGSFPHINHLDANAPGHLTKRGINYPNMSFTIADASSVTMPPMVHGGRAWISVGSPMFIGVSEDNKGYAGPVYDPSDPNFDVIWDFIEFAWEAGKVAFGGNPSMVDAFAIPLRFRLQQESSGYDESAGIIYGRNYVMTQFLTSVGQGFVPLESNNFRILSPRSSSSFRTGGAQQNYLSTYIDKVWQLFKDNGFSYSQGGFNFVGTFKDGSDVMDFTRTGNGVNDGGVMQKPTTADVMQCNGAFAHDGMNDAEFFLGARIGAAFNRGVATDPATWGNTSKYYQDDFKNDYAQFIHTLTADKLAYGFPYDDVYDQSGVRILPNFDPPTLWTIEIGW